MAENKINGLIPAVEQAFDLASSKSFDVIVQHGVHNIFDAYITKEDASTEQVKLDIAKALKVLTKIGPDVELEEDSDDYEQQEGPDIQAKYFSSVRDGLVEFYVNSAQKYEVQVTDKGGIITILKPSSPEETKNQLFQMFVLKSMNGVGISEVGRLVLNGIFMVLTEREHFEGRFKDVFKKHHALFGKLSKVYKEATIDALLLDRGEASAWFAMEKREQEAAELEREQNAMMMEG